jgi:hypothetical protein
VDALCSTETLRSYGCVTKPKGRETGLSGFAAQIQLHSLTGSYVMATAEHREPYESRGSRTVVCPGKASMFSREQSCQGRSQSPVVWIAEGMETEPSKPIDKAFPGKVNEAPGRNKSERIVASRVSTSEGRARNRRAKAA